MDVDESATLVRTQFSLRLDLRMTYLGLRQRDVAAELQVSQQTVSKWRAGDALPSADKLPALAAALKCDVADLLGR